MAKQKKRTLAEIAKDVVNVGATLRTDPTALPGGAVVAMLVDTLRRLAREALAATEKGE